jgi:hypothetical protein
VCGWLQRVNRKGRIKTLSWPTLRYYRCISLEALRKITKHSGRTAVSGSIIETATSYNRICHLLNSNQPPTYYNRTCHLLNSNQPHSITELATSWIRRRKFNVSIQTTERGVLWSWWRAKYKRMGVIYTHTKFWLEKLTRRDNFWDLRVDVMPLFKDNFRETTNDYVKIIKLAQKGVQVLFQSSGSTIRNSSRRKAPKRRV